MTLSLNLLGCSIQLFHWAFSSLKTTPQQTLTRASSQWLLSFLAYFKLSFTMQGAWLPIAATTYKVVPEAILSHPHFAGLFCLSSAETCTRQ